MNHFHPINTIDDETDLLSKIIHLETQIRAKKERERLLNTGQNETYSRIFEPITRELKSLAQIEQKPTPVAPPATAPAVSPLASPVRVKSPITPVAPATAPATATVNPDTPHTAPAATAVPRVIFQSPQYQTLVSKIKENNREDGYLGLDIHTHTTAGNPYTVQGGLLKVTVDGEIKTFTIKQSKTWTMLLAKNPSKCNPSLTYTNSVTGQLYPHAEEYRKIATKLKYVDYCNQITANSKINLRIRTKYKLLTANSKQQTGKGFLFSVKPPTHIPILPSDPQGVLRELQKAIAEYKAGNKSMRNVIAPLAAQAKRMKILPKKFPKEFNWIYA